MFYVWTSATKDTGVRFNREDISIKDDSVMQYFIAANSNHDAQPCNRQNDLRWDAYQSTFSVLSQNCSSANKMELLRMMHFENQPYDTVTQFTRVNPAYDIDTLHVIKLDGE